MWSSLQVVREWTASALSIPAATYPQASAQRPYAVVNRAGGPVDYPHDYPRYSVQLWCDTDAQGETLAYALAMALPSITDAHERINAAGNAELTQLGYLEDGGFIWQVNFDLATNIRD